ncbi:MAG: ribosome maturation factor RimM [Erysipelotrichaceae bacterium]
MDKIKIGIIIGTHGLKGELKIKSLSDFNNERYKKGNILLIEFNKDIIKLEVKNMRIHKTNVLVEFKDYNDINMVEKYIGSNVYIMVEDLHSLEEDEVYYFQLKDCEVYDEENNILGRVIEIIETGANAVLRVNDGSKEFLLPYVKNFIVSTDTKDKKIVAHLIEGMK